MLVPGTTHSPISAEADLSLGLPPTMQPDPGFHGRQHLVDYGDLFLGLSLNPYLSPFDNRECGHARNQVNLKGANSTDVSATGMFANGHVYADQDIADHFKPFQVFDVQI